MIESSSVKSGLAFSENVYRQLITEDRKPTLIRLSRRAARQRAKAARENVGTLSGLRRQAAPPNA